MGDQVRICVSLTVCSNPLQSREEISRLNAEKPVNTDIANICLLFGQPILYPTMLFDVLATRAAVEFFANFHTDKGPFFPGHRKILGF
ncbi:hypothetical protein D3C76_1303120 [compost metagenome]